MKFTVTQFKKIAVLLAGLMMCCMAQAQWTASTPIRAIYIYPTYAVVVQGNLGGGPAGCINDDTWSFSWSQFSAPVQQRVLSMLLTARTSKLPFSAVFSDTTCGPEGKKLFTGEVSM